MHANNHTSTLNLAEPRTLFEDAGDPFVQAPSLHTLGSEFRFGSKELFADTELPRLMHGVTCARMILHDANNPLLVVVRFGKNGRVSPVGGNLEAGEYPIDCAIREAAEESDYKSLSNISLLTVLVQSEKGAWVKRARWESWGYAADGLLVEGNKIWTPETRTAIFSAPLVGSFSQRRVEEHDVGLIDLATVEEDKIRSRFRPLFAFWRAKHEHAAEIPSSILYTRMAS